MSDYKTTSSPYHSKRQVGGKGSANNLGLRKYEATTEYSFDNTPSEDEEFDKYVVELGQMMRTHVLSCHTRPFMLENLEANFPAAVMSSNGYSTSMNGTRSRRRYYIACVPLYDMCISKLWKS